MEHRDKTAIAAYVLPGAPAGVEKLIRPARAPRAWMDRTPGRYAYRCIPLSAANTMGWEILNPVACELLWTGLTPPDQLTVYAPGHPRFGPRSHFGSGVVTWELPFLFETPPAYGLVVCGPANHDREHITPLDGFVRTDWLPFPFTVNWRLTSANQPVRFEENEPIARIFPFPLATLEELHLDLHDLADNPELESRFHNWRAQRQASYRGREAQGRAAAGAGEIDRDPFWSRRYAKGEGAEAGIEQHQTVFRCQAPRDRRRSGPVAVDGGANEKPASLLRKASRD